MAESGTSRTEGSNSEVMTTEANMPGLRKYPGLWNSMRTRAVRVFASTFG